MTKVKRQATTRSVKENAAVTVANRDNKVRGAADEGRDPDRRKFHRRDTGCVAKIQGFILLERFH